MQDSAMMHNAVPHIGRTNMKVTLTTGYTKYSVRNFVVKSVPEKNQKYLKYYPGPDPTGTDDPSAPKTDQNLAELPAQTLAPSRPEPSSSRGDGHDGANVSGAHEDDHSSHRDAVDDLFTKFQPSEALVTKVLCTDDNINAALAYDDLVANMGQESWKGVNYLGQGSYGQVRT